MLEQTPQPLTESETERYTAMARNTVAQVAQHIKRQAEANEGLSAQAESLIAAPGLVVFAHVLILLEIENFSPGFLLPSGNCAYFDGEAYGPGLGIDICLAMAAYFVVPESEIFGSVSFKVDFLGSFTKIEWKRGKKCIGYAYGAGAGGGLGLAYGSGVFEKRSP